MKYLDCPVDRFVSCSYVGLYPTSNSGAHTCNKLDSTATTTQLLCPRVNLISI